MKNKLTHNLGLKILALLCATLLWVIAVNINDPVDTINFTVEVTLLNKDIMTDNKKMVEVMEGSNKVKVSIRGSRSGTDYLTEEDIVATADLKELAESEVLGEAQVPIRVSATRYNKQLEEVKAASDYLTVNVEKIQKKQFVIEASVQGDPADGYVRGRVSLDQTAIIVSGPQSAIQNISKVQIQPDISGLIETQPIPCPIILLDKEGTEIQNPYLTLSARQVNATISILQLTTVPLMPNIAGDPMDNYAFTGEVTCDPETILIAGASSLIDRTTKIDIPSSMLDITGRASNLDVDLDVRKFLPEGILLADSEFSGNVHVTAVIEREVRENLNLPLNKIEFVNLPEGYTAMIDTDDTIIKTQVRGLQTNMDTLVPEEVTGSVDINAILNAEGMNELKAGSYSAVLKLSLPNGLEIVSPESLEIIIEKE